MIIHYKGKKMLGWHREFVRNCIRCTTTLYDHYKNPSTAKQTAYNDIREEVYTYQAEIGLVNTPYISVMNANSQAFTVGVEITGNEPFTGWFIVYTRTKCYYCTFDELRKLYNS